MRIFFAIHIWALLFSLPARADSFSRLGEDDKQAHAIIAFQATWLVERAVTFRHAGAAGSVLLATALLAAASFAKEKFVDPHFDPYDIDAAAAGSVVASALYLVLPPRSFTMDVEGGLESYVPEGGGGAPKPPTSVLIKAQNTFWIGNRLGVHFFSGGFDNGRKDDSGKRLHYGGGLRTALLTLNSGGGKDRAQFMVYGGADYGRLLFATASQNSPYPGSLATAFYSLGFHLHAPRSFEFSFEGELVPYGAVTLLGFGAGVGFAL